jgi:hypothetical protein
MLLQRCEKNSAEHCSHKFLIQQQLHWISSDDFLSVVHIDV